MKRFFFARVGLLLVFLTGSGCKKASVTQQPPLPVNVVTAIEKEVREWDEFTRRLDPVESVEIRPRVSRGKILRLILAAQATVVWSTDNGARTNLLDTIHESRLNLSQISQPQIGRPVQYLHLHSFGNAISVGKVATGR